MTLDAAITLLRKAVKWSEVKNQKHIDFSLCVANERALYQEALMLAQIEVEKGTLTQDELKARLGLE
ncbi:MAG: hypothetical protein H7336_13150 [Bacteriovorax sp.]|nr:hypothetical protein [Bacteriovorax sp.]